MLPRLLLTVCLATASLAAIGTCQDRSIPHLEQRGNATQLIVDGKPFLMLGGELHNSSSSSVEYMQGVYPRLRAMHLNTAVLPVAWETIEPEEGRFNFSSVDALLAGARRNSLKLVVLWFGTWKNTYSSYATAWVKTDTQRFPRVMLSNGHSTERLSPFSLNARKADALAFAALMHHLRETDSQDHTVLLVQVENEVGVIPEERDFSPAADAAFHQPVPQDLLNALQSHRASLQPELRTAWERAGARTSGLWQEVFGSEPLTDDLFMAWQFASYIEQVTRAGKHEYPLPMYTNAALIRPNYQPGQYNSGGPLPHSFDLWRAAAPSLDFFSPDIYFNEFAYWAGRYTQQGNPLFVPEAQGGAAGAANALYAFGQLRAMGFSPFGIDDVGYAPLDLVGITTGSEPPDGAATAAAYTRLEHLLPLLVTAQANGTSSAGLIEGEAQRAARVRVGEYVAEITRAGGPPGARIGVLFLQTAPGEMLAIGSGDAQVSFSTRRPGPPITGIVSIDEMVFDNGAWVTRRRMNGDENGQGQGLRLRASDTVEGKIYHVRLYRYGAP